MFGDRPARTAFCKSWRERDRAEAERHGVRSLLECSEPPLSVSGRSEKANFALPCDDIFVLRNTGLTPMPDLVNPACDHLNST